MIESIIKKQRDYFNSSETLSYLFRINSLKLLKEQLYKYQFKLQEAFIKDYNKQEFDFIATEFSMVIMELNYMIKHLKKFMKIKKVKSNLINFPATVSVLLNVLIQVIMFVVPFFMYKFRSMSNAKDEKGNLLSDDERLGRFGKLLRSTSLDELPSLLNVICGKVSLVGPRALYVKYISRYSLEQARRLEVRPGITGLAQVNGRNAISWEKRFEYDVEYVDSISFIGDWKILFKTIGKVFKREGITSSTSVTMEEFMGTTEELMIHE